jgi:hypothetical protein
MSGSIVFRWLLPGAVAALLAIPVHSVGASPMGGGHGMGGGGMHMGGMGRGGFSGRGMAMRSRPGTSSHFFSHGGTNHFSHQPNQSFQNHHFNGFGNHNSFGDNHFGHFGHFDHFDHFDHDFFFRHNFFVGFNFGAFGWWPGWWWGGPWWWWGWDGWAYPDSYCGYEFDYNYGYGYSGDDPPADAQYGSTEYWSDLAMSVQTKLADDGYYQGEIDGVLGSGSLEAIRQFQTDHGLAATGKIDPKLLSALGIQYNQQGSQRSANADRSWELGARS